MRHFAIAALALGNMGCAIGWGSAFVGEWRARKEIDYRACLEDDRGQCIQRRETTKHLPARAFTGAVLGFPMTMGGAIVRQGGVTSTKLRLEPTLEILRGRGPWALGVRVGAALDIDNPPVAMFPVTLHGHYAFTENFNAYGGAGWVPFSFHKDEQSIIGARALLGARWSFANIFRQTFWNLGFEANTTWVDFDQPYLSTGMTGYVGAFF